MRLRIKTLTEIGEQHDRICEYLDEQGFLEIETPVFEFREDDNNEYMLLIRNKFPKFTIKIHDNCDLKQLSDAMKSCSEFIKRQQK